MTSRAKEATAAGLNQRRLVMLPAQAGSMLSYEAGSIVGMMEGSASGFTWPT